MSADIDGSDQERRKELEKQFRESKEKAGQLSQLGADISRVAAKISDAADLGIEAAKYGSPYGDWENSIESASRLNRSLEVVSGIRTSWFAGNSVAANTASSALFYSNTLVSEDSIAPLAYDERKEASRVAKAYERHFENAKIFEEVLDLIRSLRFETTDGGRLAIDKFKNAWDLYEQKPHSSDPAIGSLISLRQAIIFTVDELIRRRPRQRKLNARGKIKELGQQLAYTGIEKSAFDDWELQFSQSRFGLMDLLSGAKKNITPREAETELIQKGTRFLHVLLGAIDPAKLRS